MKKSDIIWKLEYFVLQFQEKKKQQILYTVIFLCVFYVLHFTLFFSMEEPYTIIAWQYGQ